MDTNLVSLRSTFEERARQFKCTCLSSSANIAHQNCLMIENLIINILISYRFGPKFELNKHIRICKLYITICFIFHHYFLTSWCLVIKVISSGDNTRTDPSHKKQSFHRPGSPHATRIQKVNLWKADRKMNYYKWWQRRRDDEINTVYKLWW